MNDRKTSSASLVAIAGLLLASGLAGAQQRNWVNLSEPGASPRPSILPPPPPEPALMPAPLPPAFVPAPAQPIRILPPTSAPEPAPPPRILPPPPPPAPPTANPGAFTSSCPSCPPSSPCQSACPGQTVCPPPCPVLPPCPAKQSRGCPRYWVGADYLLWWVKDGPAAGPLITSGSALDTFPGVIGQPGTAVLFGNQPLDFGTFSGLRVNAGAWLDPEAQVGVEGRGFFLAQRSVNFTAASDGVGAPVLARPVINAITGAETAFLVSFPATAVGTVSAEAATRLWGAEANALANLARNETWVVEGLVGFRYLNLRERLQVGSSFTPLVGPGPFTFLGAPVPAGSRLTEFDRFDTQNHFWGGQVGGRVSWARDALNVGVRGTVALGCTDQTVTTSGASSLTNGTTTTATGGIQAVSSNIGQRWSNSFSVVPEVGLDLGWQLASWAQVRVGYSFLYWSGVVRPGEQVDRQVNPGLVPTDQDFGIPGGPVRPASQFNRTDFWAHGLNFGAELTF